ncbi:MAG: hypothetical protein M9936_24865 [Caldilinea sp.]|nr:hypothetical protein [Caldilinea sp.]
MREPPHLAPAVAEVEHEARICRADVALHVRVDEIVGPQVVVLQLDGAGRPLAAGRDAVGDHMQPVVAAATQQAQDGAPCGRGRAGIAAAARA